MKNDLGKCLGEVIIEASDFHGYIPNVSKTVMDNCKRYCLILSNKDSGKVALMGVMTDQAGKEFINSFLIDVYKWNWASDEGFSIDEVFTDNRLYKQIFTMVPPNTLPKLLA